MSSLKPGFVLHAVPFIFLLGCASSEPRKVLLTGVNEKFVPAAVATIEADLNRQRKADPGPYSDLVMKGPLPKDAVIREAHRHRQAFDRCYREIFGVADRVAAREARQAYDQKLNRVSQNQGKIQPDGVAASTNFNTPVYRTHVTTGGDVTMHFMVRADGVVEEARTSLSDLRSPVFHECLEKVVKDFRFANQSAPTQVRHLLLRFSHEYGFLKSDKH